MDNYNETQSTKELENLFNELFVNDFKRTLETNQQVFQTLFDRFKQELKEIVKDDLIGQVDNTLIGVKSSYESIISGIRDKENELISQLEKCNQQIQRYDMQINSNLIESKQILSETSQEIGNVIHANKTLLYVILGISSVSLILSILGFIL